MSRFSMVDLLRVNRKSMGSKDCGTHRMREGQPDQGAEFHRKKAIGEDFFFSIIFFSVSF